MTTNNFSLFFFFSQKRRRRQKSPVELLPPQKSDFQGKKFLRKNFHPFISGMTGRCKLATNGGSSRHFYTHLNALKTARIESREDSKTHSVAKIGENGVFFVKRARRFRNERARRFRNAGVLKTPESTMAPKMGESRITTHAFYKKNTIFPDFGDGKCLTILSTFDSRCF